MGNLADLKTKLVALAADIDDALDKLECLADIDSWYDTRTAIDTLTATDVQSYSVGGRTVTRTDIPNLQATERDLYERILGKLYYRGGGQADLRSTEVETSA